MIFIANVFTYFRQILLQNIQIYFIFHCHKFDFINIIFIISVMLFKYVLMFCNWMNSRNWRETSTELETFMNIILQNFFYSDYSFPSYFVWGTLVSVQIFDSRFLTDLHDFGSRESERKKNSMVSGCSLVSCYVC